MIRKQRLFSHCMFVLFTMEHQPYTYEVYEVTEEHYNPNKDTLLPALDEFLVQLKVRETTVDHFYQDDSSQDSTETRETTHVQSFTFGRQVLSNKEDAVMVIIEMLSMVDNLDLLDIPSQLIDGIYVAAILVAKKTCGRKVLVEIAFAPIHNHYYYIGSDEDLSLLMEDNVPLTEPATKSSIETLEKVRVERVETCVVCFEEFLIGSKITRMPCLHVFHEECIVPWLETSHICPLCRFKMPII